MTKQDRKQGGCSLKFEKQLAKEAKERQRGGQGGVLLPQKFAEASKGEAREIAAKKFIQTMDRFLSSQLLPGSTQLQVGFPHTGIPENGESPGV